MENLTQSPTKILKQRFLAARELMKGLGLKRANFEAWLYEKAPVYREPEGVKRLSKVWYCYAADLALTTLVEQFVEENQNERENEGRE